MAGEVTYMPTEGDYVSAQRDWFVGALRNGRAVRGLIKAALACGLSAAAVWLVFESPRNALIVGAGMTIVGAILIPLIWGVSYLLIPRRARRLFGQSRTLHKEHSYAWSNAGIGYRTENHTGKLVWSDFHRWSEGRNTFQFYLNDGLFHYIPRRTMTEAQVEDLRDTATALGPRRR